MLLSHYVHPPGRAAGCLAPATSDQRGHHKRPDVTRHYACLPSLDRGLFRTLWCGRGQTLTYTCVSSVGPEGWHPRCSWLLGWSHRSPCVAAPVQRAWSDSTGMRTDRAPALGLATQPSNIQPYLRGQSRGGGWSKTHFLVALPPGKREIKKLQQAHPGVCGEAPTL